MRIISGSGTQSVAPTHKGVKISRSRGSWERPDSILNRSDLSSSNSLQCHSRKWDKGRCVPTMPFGWPVVPEVKTMYAVSSGATVFSKGSDDIPRKRSSTPSFAWGIPKRQTTWQASRNVTSSSATGLHRGRLLQHLYQTGCRILRIEE